MSKRYQFLVVENDPDDAFLIRMAFDSVPSCGACFLARNTSEAKAYLKGAGMYADRDKYPFPHAIISDLRMPGGTGIDLFQEIQEDPDLKQIPVIILTGSASPAEMEAAQRVGPAQVLRKPSNLEELKRLLRMLAKNLCGTE